MTWVPLLEGRMAQQASVVLAAVARGLGEVAGTVPEPSFSSGCMGLALFHGYHSLAFGAEPGDLVIELLNRGFEQTAQYSGSLGFFGGVTGVAWSGRRLELWLTGETSAEATEEVDRIVRDSLRAKPWNWHYDLVYGLAGIACYALDHPDRTFAAEVILAVLERLSELAQSQTIGLTWWTPPKLMSSANAKKFPEGHYNLGLAHGVAGVIAVLGRICAEGLGDHLGRELLEGAVAWLLAQRRREDGGSSFPYHVSAREKAVPAASARSAWCYGDPGISAAILGAARAVGDPAWEREAIAIARRDCRRDFAQTGVLDAELCHGSAGLGHLYNRLFQATRVEEFAEASRKWFRHTLEMHRPGEGVGGFSNWWPEIQEWRGDLGLLTGTAGIGLALTAALSPLEPSWDAPMLLSLAPQGL